MLSSLSLSLDRSARDRVFEMVMIGKRGGNQEILNAALLPVFKHIVIIIAFVAPVDVFLAVALLMVVPADLVPVFATVIAVRFTTPVQNVRSLGLTGVWSLARRHEKS